MVDVVIKNITDIITGIMTEPTRYALIIAFITSVILFLLNEWAKRRYLIHEKLLSLRLERFESLLQELYSYAAIYTDVKMALGIEIVDTSFRTKATIININRFLEKLFPKPILDEDEVVEAQEKDELEAQRWKLMNFLQNEGFRIYNNIQVKASSLHLIVPDRTIQKKANEIAEKISKYISEANKDKDYSDNIKDDLKNLVDSMREYLPSLSLID